MSKKNILECKYIFLYVFWVLMIIFYFYSLMYLITEKCLPLHLDL